MTRKKGDEGIGWFGFFAFLLLLIPEFIINKLSWGIFVKTHPGYEGFVGSAGPWQYLQNPSLVLTLSFYGFDLVFLVTAFMFSAMTSSSRRTRSRE